MMIVISIVLVILTGGFLYYALFMKNTESYTRLEDIYKDKYHRDQERLAKELKSGEIDQATHDEQMTFLGRDLIAVAADGKKANASVRWTLIIGMLIIAIASLVIFWRSGYDPVVQTLDNERMEIKKSVKDWVETIDISDLRSGKTIADLNPPQVIVDNSKETFMALNMLSSRDNHNNLKYLYLLGDIYYRDLNMLQVANDIYINLYEKEEEKFKPYANNMFLYMQLAMNDFILNERLEYNYDRLVQENSYNDSMVLQYAMILAESKKYEKALILLEHLEKGYDSEEDQNARLALKALSDQLKSFAQEERQIYRVNATFTIDQSMDNLPDRAILFVYLRDKNQLAGPPLAAKKVPLKSVSWPLEVELRDNDILMESDRSLESYGELQISARVSLTGEPIAQHGDIEAKAQMVTKGEMSTLLLDQRVIK